MITLWHPRIIRRRIAITFTANAGTGDSVFAKRGAVIRIANIPENDSMEPILVHDNLKILGKVFGVFRLYE